MDFIEWRDDYRLGDDLIDAHHRVFFDMVRDLSRQEQVGGLRPAVPAVVDFLADYIEMHFGAEESVMQAHGFPLLDEHHEAHQAFSRQVAAMQEKIMQAPDSMTLDQLLDITQHWFLAHILDEDLKLRDWLAR